MIFCHQLSNLLDARTMQWFNLQEIIVRKKHLPGTFSTDCVAVSTPITA